MISLASALVAHRDRYIDLLTAYREGDPRPIISSFAASTWIAAAESTKTAARLAEIPSIWNEMIGPVRSDSASRRLLAHLLDRPILSAEDAHRLLEASTSASYTAIERLHQAGILQPLTDRKRNQVWGAALILDELDELDDLGERIAHAARKARKASRYSAWLHRWAGG